MDEPLSNLDANLREEMRFEIRRLHEEFRITTVYVTHDQAEAMATSDRIAVLDRAGSCKLAPRWRSSIIRERVSLPSLSAKRTFSPGFSTEVARCVWRTG